MLRSRCVAILGAAVIAAATGCAGAIDRTDFEDLVHARGGGLATDLPTGAIAALRQRLGRADFQATVILLTAPNSASFQLVVPDQPAQVSRFLSGRSVLAGPAASAFWRIRVPQHPDQLDDYSYALGALGAAAPVRVAASDQLDAEAFAISEVPGLTRIEDIVDTARARSSLEQSYVSAILVHRTGADILITVNVTAARAAAVAQFDRTGTLLRVQPV